MAAIVQLQALARSLRQRVLHPPKESAPASPAADCKETRPVRKTSKGSNVNLKASIHAACDCRASSVCACAEEAFNGNVAQTPGNKCIVSFPGKFPDEWERLKCLCEKGEMSSACVYFPRSDPRRRFGQHARNPDTPGKCWCHSIYGEEKSWGCCWFDEWQHNVEQAVSMNLDLVVIFFPGEVGQGRVGWNELRSSDLWNSVGLGGSQKGEVAYLEKHSYRYQQEDINWCQDLWKRQ